MDPSTSTAAGQAARDEELRGECVKAFAHYKKGNLTQAVELVQKLLARHPAHPLLHFAYMRLAHAVSGAGAVGERQEAVQGV
jgi:outer membrane protein assembly factor BamD (BamD/ComL family)